MTGSSCSCFTVPSSAYLYGGREDMAARKGFHPDSSRWYASDGTLLVPGSLQWKVIKTLREFTYLGRGALSVLVSRVLKGKGLNQVIQ